MNWQLITVILIFLAALAYLGHYLYGKFKKDECPGCGTCSSSQQEEAIRKFRERVS